MNKTKFLIHKQQQTNEEEEIQQQQKKSYRDNSLIETYSQTVI